MAIKIVQENNPTTILSMVKNQEMGIQMRQAIMELSTALKHDKMTIEEISQLEKVMEFRQGILLSALCWLQMREFINQEIIGGKEKEQITYYSLRNGVEIS